MGTERLRKEEVVKVRNKLRDEKTRLRSAITQMSVTLYTTRAQKQFKAMGKRMDEVDRALHVFERDAVYVRV